MNQGLSQNGRCTTASAMRCRRVTATATRCRRTQHSSPARRCAPGSTQPVPRHVSQSSFKASSDIQPVPSHTGHVRSLRVLSVHLQQPKSPGVARLAPERGAAVQCPAIKPSRRKSVSPVSLVVRRIRPYRVLDFRTAPLCAQRRRCAIVTASPTASRPCRATARARPSARHETSACGHQVRPGTSDRARRG